MPGDNVISDSVLDRIGLCARCRFQLEQPTKRGGLFFRCALANRDGRFERYPAIPVLSCDGFEGGNRENCGHEGRERPGIE